MGKKHINGPEGKRRKHAPREEEASEISVEEGDIEALARSSLNVGETILGEGRQSSEVESRGVCHAPLILQKLEDIEYKVPKDAKRVPWIDTLCIDGWKEVPKDIKAKDGVKLEGAFIELANEAVKESYRRLRVMKVPASRPTDFYAEMLRSDSQMFKVRERASEEQRRMKVVDMRKAAQVNKKFAKAAKVKKAVDKAGEKKRTLEDIADWQEKRKQHGKNVDEQDLEDILDRGKKGDGSDPERRKKKKGENLKRQAINKKWGHGGKKKYAKSNDAASTNDMSFSPWARKGGKGKDKGKGGGKGGGKKKGKSKGGSKGKGKGKGK